MSSTNKTNNMNLNQWTGSDIPCRADFNNDNSIIDTALGNHLRSSDKHTSTDEKAVWYNPYFITTYYGNGSSTRTYTINCAFEPTTVFVFAVSKTPSVIDIGNEANYNYFGIASLRGSTTGLSISGKNLNLTQSSVAAFGTEYQSYNQQGVTYVIVAFR